ncbi:MAG: hypothetical protein JO006_09730 [Paucibacter sp.]|nr:hypothetical protein [Roseateles sp.]
MNLLSKINRSAHHWREGIHLPWSEDSAFTPSGQLVMLVALASVAAAVVLVTV